MLEHLGWTELLRRWSAEAITYADEIRLDVSSEMRESGWIGAPPARPQDIAAAEAYLGRRLPPSYRDFLAITDGWPAFSFDFGRLRRLSEVDWVAAANPRLYKVVCETFGDDVSPDDEDGSPLMNNALLLSTGHDNFLFDVRRVAADGEWGTATWTSWGPGAGHQRPSFRAGLEAHYANFVRFAAVDSATHEEIADQVEDAYQRSLRGDRSGEQIFSDARSFGSDRADALEVQVQVLTSGYRAESKVSNLTGQYVRDAAMVTDIWPMFVTTCMDPRDPGQWAIDLVMRRDDRRLNEVISTLVDRHQRDGGLSADFDYAPGFAGGAGRARELVRAGRDEEAWKAIVEALPEWRPMSPVHLAPMGLVWDRDLARIMTRERRLELLNLARGSN